MVAWLEHRAGAALDRTEAAAQRSGGSGARFARDEGVPLATLRALGRPGTAALVGELDPDAPTRCDGRAAEAGTHNQGHQSMFGRRLLPKDH